MAFKRFQTCIICLSVHPYLKVSSLDKAVVDPCTLTLSVTSTIFPAVVQSVSPGELQKMQC